MCSLLKQIYVKGKSLSHSKLHLIKLHISTTKTVQKKLSITALQNGIQFVKTQGKLTTMYSRNQTFGVFKCSFAAWNWFKNWEDA